MATDIKRNLLPFHCVGVVFEADDFGGISSAVVGVTGSLQVAAGGDPAELHIPHTISPDHHSSFTRLLNDHYGEPDHRKAKFLHAD